jgi:hypothetical protein
MAALDKPVIGRDVGALRSRLNLSTDEMTFVLGITNNRYHLIVNQEADEPVRSIPVALMTRLLSMDDSLLFLPKFPSPQDLYEEVQTEINKKEFSVILGNHGTSMQRWGKGGKRATPQVYRLALIIQIMVATMGLKKAISHAKQVATLEASLRRIPNILEHGRWNPVPPRKASTKKKKK